MKIKALFEIKPVSTTKAKNMTADKNDFTGKNTNNGSPARGDIIILLNPAVDILPINNPK